MSTTIQIDTVQIIYSDNSRVPLIGPSSPNNDLNFTPWKWDERVWTSEYFENSEMAIAALTDQDTRGIPENYWQCGVGSTNLDLEILKLYALRQNSQERWTPLIRHGNYYKFDKERYLFADRSQIEFVDNADNEDGRNILQLSYIPRFGSPILALMWTRNELDEPMVFRNIVKRLQFTGIYDDDGEQDTVDENGDFIWASVDTSRKEFVVQWTEDQTSSPKLYFNQDITFLVGKASVSTEDDLEYCDYLGEGQGADEDQIMFLKYFPIIDNSELKIYKLIGSSISEMVRWIPGYSGPPDPEYVIDVDRGEITFPSEVNGVSTGITPPAFSTHIYAVYRPTLEIEYEPENCNNFLTAPYVNINPLHSTTNKGLIYLTERELRVAYIELTADAQTISEDTYGPLYLGLDYCFVIATAYNNHDQPIPGVEISFYLDAETDGYLNGTTALAGSEVTAITDNEGKARVIYSSPRSVEAVGQYLKHESGGSEQQYELTLIHTNGITSDTLDGIFVYQVFNDDGMQKWYDDLSAGDGEEPGYGGRKVVLYRRAIASALGGGIDDIASSNRFAGDSDYLHPRTEEAGDVVDVWIPLQPAEISGSILTFKDSLGSTIDLPWTEDPPDDWTISHSYIINDVVRNDTTSKWYKCTTAHTSTSAKEPGIGSNWENYWDEDLNAGNLVAYWVSSGKQITIHAKAFSYLYNDWIDSNDIEFRVNLPEYLTGVYVNENGNKIPYGFRLYDDYSAASGLDGATFMSIHPAVGKWPIIWDGSSLNITEHPDPFITSDVLGHTFTVVV